LPQPDAAMLSALVAPEPSAASALSDALVAELLAADCLVIATPLWNFGIPAALKAWIDLVVRAGKTFQYTADGVTGLAQGKRAYVLVASGGVFSEGPWAEWDGAVPYLRRILGFIGITEVEVIRIEGSISPIWPGRPSQGAGVHQSPRSLNMLQSQGLS
jgi:FMN-dependent NADH-azoreductase